MMAFWSSMPEIWANYLSILGFVLLLLLVWRIPRHLIFSGAPDQARWRDIRIWATVLIAIQIVLYTLFS
ncbi:MAG: hypothetical protein AAF513_08410 [Pseudomonadota bacterium]